MRIALFLGIALLIFLPFNAIAYRQLARLHPRRKRLLLMTIALGNLMWPFFPLLRSFTTFGRVTRAVLGPLWFGWTSFAILYSLLLFVLLLAWLPFSRRVDFTRFARPVSRVFLWLTIASSIAGCYQALVPLRVEHVPVAIADLPAAAEGMKIALLTDLHVGLFTRPSRLDEIFATTAAERPDVVLLAGDLIDDDPHFVPKLLAGTRALPQATPLLGVLGNHEMYGDPHRVIASLRGSRIRLLVNEGGAHGPLWIAGISDYAANREAPELKPNLGAAMNGMPASATPILLAHQPKAFDDAIRHSVALTLAGHTHGGQCGFRPLRLSLAGVFLKRHMGLYREGAAQLYINTGTGYWLVPFRLGMTPEIAIIELRRAASAPSRTAPRP
jgi:predicted MPP superfamily phosphohydrolase